MNGDGDPVGGFGPMSSTERNVATLVMARAPEAGKVKTRLEPMLRPDGCAELQAVLLNRAARWAHHVAPGNAFVAYTPYNQLERVLTHVPPGIDAFSQEGDDLGQRLTAATERVFSLHPGPLLVIGTDLPGLSTVHADAALDDLASGCDVTIGPADDGGYYLIGMTAPHPEVFALPAGKWGTEEVLGLTLEAVREAGLHFGLLRKERDLDTPEDARAFLADPATDPEIRAVLGARSFPLT